MFRNIFFDPYKSKIYSWETINGKRFKDTIDIDYEYFITDKTRKSEILDIYGTPVIKKIAKAKENILMIKDAGEHVCESDISQEIKFLHKKYEKVEDLKPKFSDFNICFLDIEVAVEDDFPKPEEAKYPINLITMIVSKTKEIFTFGTEDYTGKLRENQYYFHCKNEKQLLDSFITLFRKKQIDIITGWYIGGPRWQHGATSGNRDIGFDIPYIINRCSKLQIEKSLSPINKIIKSRSTGGYTIAGISCLDYMEIYKKYTKEKRESYSLDYICDFELKQRKLQYEGSLNDLYRNDWNKFVEYNVQDILLVQQLESKLKYLELTITLSYEALVPFERSFSSISVLTGYILKKLHSKNRVMPDRQNFPEEEYPGAHVFAKPGMYEELVSFDVESLYPTLIRMFNISPETLVDSQNIDKIQKLRNEGNLISSPAGVYYDKSKKGIIPEVVESIFNERKRFKKLKENAKKNKDKQLVKFYDGQQYIRKILINSIYGVLGNRYFHFYNVKNAKAITLGGQDVIKFLSTQINDYFKNYFYQNKNYFGSIDIANKLKNDLVVLIDTDSNYISLKELKEKSNRPRSFLPWAKEFIGKFIDPLVEKLLAVYSEKYNIPQLINFNREKIISKMLILAKKKYAVEVLDDDGAVPDERISTTGLESKRTSTPYFCRGKMKDVLDKIFETRDSIETLDFIKQIKKEFKKLSIGEIASPRGISDYKKFASQVMDTRPYPKSCPMHVRAAINYNKLNKKYKLRLQPISNGSKLKYIYVYENNELRTNVVAFVGNYPEKFKEIFKIDYDMQWRKTFQDAVQRFFDVLQWGKINFSSKKLLQFLES